jgi:hypothetical protein
MRSISRASGLLAMMPLALTAACSDPELSSDLDTDGPPEVLEVNVANETAPTDPNGNAVEDATYCRAGDEFKVSTFYCPLARDETDAPIPGDRAKEGAIIDAIPYDGGSCTGEMPFDPATCTGGWNTRFVFAELLDPDIETLTDNGDGTMSGSLEESQPFTVTCNDEVVAYGGWYDPSGNNLSYPPGPGLMMQPLAFVATGSSCEVALADDKVTDKDGEPVPSDMLGPYGFTVAPLAVAASEPAADAEGVDPAAPIALSFNAPIDLTSVTADNVVVAIDEEGATPIALGDFTYLTDDDGGEDPTTVLVTPEALDPGTKYVVTVSTDIADIAGGLLDADHATTFSFTTGEAP